MSLSVDAYVDGGSDSEGAYIGVLLIDSDTKRLLYGEGMALGAKSNNEAEYSAVIVALREAISLGATRLLIHSDSSVVVNQVNGKWKIHANHLKDYFDEIQHLIGTTNLEFGIKWIPRNQNRIADYLTRMARSNR